MSVNLRAIVGVSVLLGLGTACGHSANGEPGSPSGGSGAVNAGAGGDAGAGADAGGSGGVAAGGATSAGTDAGGADSAGDNAGGADTAGDSSVGASAGTDAGGASSAGTAGLGGAAGNGPIDIGPQKKSDKLDVLFVVDNSVSMADKQNILEASLPHFIKRLINPTCVDALGNPTAQQPASGDVACISGSREFTPVSSLHLGVITTSIGGHGGTVCTTGLATDTLDDHAELVPKQRTGVPSYQGSGYLSYDATGVAGVTDVNALVADLKTTVTAAGEHGCGYEAPLEAMYRFLVDPEPPLTVTQVNGVTTPGDVNTALLAERASFLRPDSSVAVVILSDENDCSIRDDGVGWFVGASSRMPHATSACDANPNDPCCRSCAQQEAAPPAGCAPLLQDSMCQTVPTGQQYATWDSQHDSLNLRCFDQTRRFGFDLLYPVDRYSNALSNPQVQNRAGALVPNPLLAARDGKPARSATLVSVSVIIGAPWQDLATTSSLTPGQPLTYLDGASLDSQARWPVLLGSPALNVPPSDPFMRESVAARSGTNPITSAPIVTATSLNPLESPINGHEQNIVLFDDLQFACTFALPTPKPCANGDTACACSADKAGNLQAVTEDNSPLCQPPAGGAPSNTQYYGKGYPGARELSFAKQLGARAVGGSICPKVLNDANSVDYAYTPALNALIGRIASTMK